MVAEKITTDSWGGIFTAALLLTGSRRRAEAAMTESLRSLAGSTVPCKVLGAALFCRVVTASLEGLQHVEAEPGLPKELQRVMLLAPRPRHCFVLRFLLELPREVCAWLLHLSAEQVDEYSGVAAQALAVVMVREKAA